MKLLIVESPNKVTKLTNILGEGWTVAASVGHIRDLPERGLGVEPPRYVPQYELTERGKGVAEKLKRLAQAADQVYLATDPDREGEAIAWHLQQVLRLDKPLRCTFNDINAGPVLAAVAKPRSIDTQLVAAQEARRILDRLVGYLVSPKLSNGSGTRMPAGRVQSPAVRLVVDRERAIERFKPTKHYSARLHFDGGWSADWQTETLFPEEPHYCMAEDVAKRVSTSELVIVAEAADTTRSLNPYAPFTTSALQQAASTRLRMSPKTAMDTAQKLFEQGLITYHRTDSPNLSAAGFAEIAAYALTKGVTITEQRRFKVKGDAQEAHEAIRPSHIEDENAGSTDDEKKLYRLIRQRALASQMPAAQFAVRSATLKTSIAGREVVFQAKGETLVSQGWKAVYAEDQDDDGDGLTANPVPALSAGQSLRPARGEVLTKQTKAPKRYTRAALVRELEEQGIGRPSTYAAIMEKIVESDYIVVDAKEICQPTDRARSMVDSLVGTMSFIELGFTRDIEADLDKIAAGQGDYVRTVAHVHTTVAAELERLSVRVAEGTPLCPDCKKPLSKTKGTNGVFWRCTGYPECRTTLPDDKGKPGARKPKAEVSGHACPSCGRGLVNRTKPGAKGYNFWSCSGYPACKTSVPDKSGAPDLSAHKGGTAAAA